MMLTILIICIIPFCSCLDNGLGLVPPMGWLSWLRYRCTVDCKKYPDACISENLIMTMANIISTDYKMAGYEYVMIDDCWMAGKRAPNGSLLPDPVRFPRGMKFLSDYIHSKGLKFGLYEDYGFKTCGGYPGSLGHLMMDADTFASWGVDYVKFDGCYSCPRSQPDGISKFSGFLNKTGRPIFLNVEWPLYIGVKHMNLKDSTKLRLTTNMARVFNDIDDNWNSLLNIINFFKANVNDFASWAGPGYFNDPDMLLIGNNYIRPEQEQLQMTMWAMYAAPLIMSNDLKNVSSFSKFILTNKNIIAINQDPMGIQGRYIKTINLTQIWMRPLTNSRVALALVNLESKETIVYFSLNDIGITDKDLFLLTEVFYMKMKVKLYTDTMVHFSLNATSSIILECQKL